MELLTNINKKLTSTVPQPVTSFVRDQDDIFGEMISKEIKNFSKVLKAKFKHEVNKLLYEFQIQQFQNEEKQVPETSTLAFLF